MSDVTSRAPLGRRALGGLAAGALLAPHVARAQARRTTIRLAHHVTTQSEQHAAAELFGRKLSEATGGALVVQVLPAAQMGGQREIVESVSIGTLEMGYGESGLYANYLPAFGVIALPYLYRDFDHWKRVADGPVAEKLNGDLEKQSGIKPLTWITAGYRNTYLRSKPIEKPADFRGVRVRLPEAPVFVRTFAALGAQPTPIPAPEMYTALQTGVVDAMEGSAEVGFTFKIHEVTRFLSLTRHILLDGSFCINARFLSRLGKPEQDAIAKAAAEAAAEARAQHFDRERMWFERMAQGGQIQRNEPDLAPFMEVLTPLQGEFAAAARGAEILEQIRRA